MKKLTRFVKRYGIWIGALGATLTALHWLRLDGPHYWDLTLQVFQFLLTEVTLLVALVP